MVDVPSLPPRATYRLQLTRDFTFADAAATAPLMQRLGVSHAYLSPILTARPGSTHGYDVTDHDEINPELGGEAGFRTLVEVLHGHGLGVLLDIVPNHMGVGPGNARWMDLLRWGQASDEAQFFDIDWQPPQAELAGKVLLPFLGGEPGELIAKGEIQLAFDGAGFAVHYHDHVWPVTPTSVGPILEYAAQGAPDLQPLARDFLALDALAAAPAALRARAEQLGSELAARRDGHAAVKAAVGAWNGSGRHRFEALLDRQCWRLADWHRAATEINYRRFFAINDLVAIRAERAEVFEASHALILRLVEEGLVDGLRIDHIDGLADPKTYLDRLAAAMAARGREPYILVEKILGAGEALPAAWPVAGTTGYDRLGPIDRLFCDPDGADAIVRHYCRLTGRPADPGGMLLAAKTRFLETEFASEMTRLAHAARAAAGDMASADDLRRAMIGIIAHLPVYRTYADAAGIDETERGRLDAAVDAAAVEPPALKDFLKNLLAGKEAPAVATLFQQLSGPAMAKGLEDTVFFQHVPLLALNEVGGEPGAGTLGLDAFHALNREKQRLRPAELIAGSTHDTKRGEDARTRLLALTSIAPAWQAAIDRWFGRLPPADTNAAIYLYQTVVGAWPPGLTTDPAAFVERVRPAMLKAVREAKEQTSWNTPDAGYEAALDRFITDLFASDLVGDIAAFAETAGFWGALTSLSAMLLRLTTPGVPDIYQGSDGWNLSMVDPDNRRPVDFAAAFERAARPRLGLDRLRAQWHDGAAKAFLIREVLAFRQRQPALFAAGRYDALPVQGAKADMLIAFRREHEGQHVVVLAPRFWPRLWPADAARPDWGRTTVELPAGRHRNLLGDNPVEGGQAVPVADVLGDFPVGMLASEA